MFRPQSAIFRFMLYILKEPAACYFLSFLCCTLYCFVMVWVPCFSCAGVCEVLYVYCTVLQLQQAWRLICARTYERWTQNTSTAHPSLRSRAVGGDW
jgi:hypothetical protein